LPERLRLNRELAQSRDGGCDGSAAGLAIEVKRQERLNIGTWLKQARGSAQNGSIPVVAYRQNHGDWKCVVEMTPLQLACYMRYRKNLDDTEATIEAAHREF
jgi:hypothetical protein